MEKPNSYSAATFAWMIPHIAAVARHYGYAVGLHGSMARDLDLIAVPWTDDAASPELLVEAVRVAVDGLIITEKPPVEWGHQRQSPAKKPHGRLAWSIHFAGHNFYIDLSVMPRIAEKFVIPGQTVVPPADLAEYEEAMKEAIPEIIAAVRKRQALAAEARLRPFGGGAGA